MISPATTPQYFGVNSSTAATTSSSTSGTGINQSLDENSFLTLLVAQLQHQDPTTPLEPYELAAQLAQFSTVEQLTQLNTAVASQTDASKAAAAVSQSAMSTSLIGREVTVVGDQVQVPSSGNANVTVDIPNGGDGTLTLTDDSGAVVATRDLGQVAAGNGQTLQLPGDLPPGDWHYSISVQGSTGSAANATTYTTGVVTGVDFKGSGIELELGGLEVSFGDLVRVDSSAAAGATGGSSGGGTGSTTPATPPSSNGGSGSATPGDGGNDPIRRTLSALSSLKLF